MTYSDSFGSHTDVVIDTNSALWLKFDASTRTFYGTPTVADIISDSNGFNSNFVITVTATD